MQIKLVDEWWLVLRKSWSARFAAASAAIGLINAIVSAVTTVYQPLWLLLASAVLGLLSYFSRAVKQDALAEAVEQRKQEKANAADVPPSA